MFWDLNGATLYPAFESNRQRAVANRLFPAEEVVP
jgi:hypothetical protein